MEKYEQQRKQNIILGEQKTKIDWDDECTFQPPPAKQMPDFARAQRHFQMLLDKKKSHKNPTKPVPFAFEANKKVPQIHYLETDNEMIKKRKEISMMRDTNQKNLEALRATQGEEKFVPNSTKSFALKVEENKKTRLEHEKKAREKFSSQKEREERQKLAAKKLREALAVAEAEKRAQKDSGGEKMTKKEQFQESTKKHQEKIREIKERVEQRPPIFQTYGDKAQQEKMMRMKRLLQLDEENKKRKINFEKQLGPEQLNELKDARLLRKMGKL